MLILSKNRKTGFRVFAIFIAVVLLIGGLLWAWVVVSYTPDYTTENTFSGSDYQSSVSTSAEDSLLTIEIDSGEDTLGWDQLSISIQVDNQDFPCSLTGISTIQQEDSKVNTRLTADGSTFAIEVDASSEETFTGINLQSMKQIDLGNHSMKFSKTDIFLGNDSVAMIVTNQSFSELQSIPNGSFNLDDSERLDWYDYDFSVHRINPKDQVYVIQESNITYKLQFISYYNDADESRHIQMLVAWLNGSQLPAFDDPTLIAESPCIIEGADDSWSPSQSITIRENGIDICNQACSVQISIQYQGVNVKTIPKVEVI